MSGGVWTRSTAAVACAVELAASGPEAGAQVHWDVGIQVGASERLTTGNPLAPTPMPGPGAAILAHVAVLPMLRAGPYAAFDLSPAPRTAARQVYAGGLRAKVTPPWLAAPWHAWAFLGAGFADAYTPRYRTSSELVGNSSIAMLELPAGIGIGYRLHGPWELCAELGARVVVARGSIHTASSNGAGEVAPIPEDDLLAVSLSVGVSLLQ